MLCELLDYVIHKEYTEVTLRNKHITFGGIMRLKRIGVLSCGKVSGVLYGGLGLIFGAILSLIAFMGVAFGSGSSFGAFGAFMGIGAIIFLPLFYGLIGFIGGIITAWLYNIVAGLTGGLEVEFDTEMNSPTSEPEQPMM